VNKKGKIFRKAIVPDDQIIKEKKEEKLIP